MGRDVTVTADADGLVPYVPAFDGIRDAYLAGEDPSPVRVWVRPLSASEARRKQSSALNGAQRKRLAGGDVSVVQDMERAAFVACVVRVENYRLTIRSPDGSEVKRVITTGAELWDHGEEGLVSEVSAAVLNLSQLERGAREPSCSQPG